MEVFSKKLKNEIVKFIKDYFFQSKAKGVVVGMSGGKDSFVTAKLCAMAIGTQNVFGLIMPDGKMNDIDIAIAECKYLGINHDIVDISLITKKIKKNDIKN